MQAMLLRKSVQLKTTRLPGAYPGNRWTLYRPLSFYDQEFHREFYSHLIIRIPGQCYKLELFYKQFHKFQQGVGTPSNSKWQVDWPHFMFENIIWWMQWECRYISNPYWLPLESWFIGVRGRGLQGRELHLHFSEKIVQRSKN